MSMHPGEPVRERRGWWAGGLAAGSVIVWFVLLTVLKPECVGDESRHLAVILSLARGEPVPPDYMPMLPAFHLAAAGLVRLCGPSLLVVRGLNVGLAVLCVVVGLALARLRPGGGGSAAALLLVWNPLFFPFTALAYTEAATVLALLIALYLHLRGRGLLSAIALLAACLIRQSSVVWVAFLVVWRLLDERARLSKPGSGQRVGWSWPRVIAEIWPHATLLAAAGVLVILRPSFAAGQSYANRAAVNVAQFYLFGLTVAVLWLPLWLEQLGRLWAAGLERALAHGRVCAAAVVAVGLLELAFDNPHPWNADPHYLRNCVLIALSTSTLARLAAGVGLVLTSVLVVAFVRAQRERRGVALAWLFSLLFITPHWLVDPRYYVVPVTLVNLLTTYGAAQGRRLLAWYALLSAAVGVMILMRGGAEGGVL